MSLTATPVEVACPTCFRRERWVADGTVLEVVLEGGSRQPASHPSLAAWRIWARSRSGELGPVVGRCSLCAMPLVADGPGLPPAQAWRLDSPRGPVEVSADTLVGPRGPLTEAEAEAFLAEQFRPPPLEPLTDLRLIPVVFLIGVLSLVGLTWLFAALYVLNFLFAMGTQGNFSAPGVP